jgi:hypothetical protein
VHVPASHSYAALSLACASATTIWVKFEKIAKSSPEALGLTAQRLSTLTPSALARESAPELDSAECVMRLSWLATSQCHGWSFAAHSAFDSPNN